LVVITHREGPGLSPGSGWLRRVALYRPPPPSFIAKSRLGVRVPSPPPQLREIRDYTRQLAAAPGHVSRYRYLTLAYLAARRYDEAREVIDAGLALVVDDRVLIEARGDVRAANGDSEGALADWAHTLDLDPEDIAPLYSTAFLHEREGRLQEAIDAWEAIRNWALARGYQLDAAWPERERERLVQELRSDQAPPNS
jgi:tetratricopeptide (TPR) repeat protein